MEGRGHLPKVSFNYIAGNADYNVVDRYAFWDAPSTVDWLKSHGYTLYRRLIPNNAETFPALPFEPCSEANYPYACYDLESDSEDERLRAVDYGGKVAFAQDYLGRHVVIKLVRAETDEFRILQMLSNQSFDTLKDNSVIPVLDMLPIEGFWLVVMPRWGSHVHLPRPEYLDEIIVIMQSILKGLVFLHANGIAHGDLEMRNVLIDHFTDMQHMITSNITRAELRSDHRLTYALFDFDLSVLVPAGIRKEDFRLPFWKSWGSVNRGNDTAGGEIDYDPFVFDVGILGVVFCEYFQHLIPKFPKLAPLLDMMTTRHLDRRFTASQALHFLEEASSELSDQDRNIRVTILQSRRRYCDYDRWQDLPPEFVERWKHYKETPIPWTTLVLRRICSKRYVCHIVPRIRWFFFQLFSIPRIILQWFMPSFRNNLKFRFLR